MNVHCKSSGKTHPCTFEDNWGGIDQNRVNLIPRRSILGWKLRDGDATSSTAGGMKARLKGLSSADSETVMSASLAVSISYIFIC
jgi:hypothetical protein